MSQVYILRGPTGCGKTTWATAMAEKYLAIRVVSADKFHMRGGKYEFKVEHAGKAHDLCLIEFADLLLTDLDVVVDNTNIHLWEIAPYYRLAQIREKEVKIISFWISLEESFKRNVHDVPFETCYKMYRGMLEERIPSHWNHEWASSSEFEIIKDIVVNETQPGIPTNSKPLSTSFPGDWYEAVMITHRTDLSREDKKMLVEDKIGKKAADELFDYLWKPDDVDSAPVPQTWDQILEIVSRPHTTKLEKGLLIHNAMGKEAARKFTEFLQAMERRDSDTRQQNSQTSEGHRDDDRPKGQES